MSKATTPDASTSTPSNASRPRENSADGAESKRPQASTEQAAPNQAAAEGEEAAADAPSPADSKIAELSAALAERDARLEATLGQYKEALDEFGRVKTRLTRDVAREVAQGKKTFLTQMLEVIDNLERALESALADPQQAASPLCQGITMVRDQFHAKLEAQGVKKLAALGQPFDPLHFEAVSTVPVTDAAKDGQVIGVMRDAYLLGEETLRHGIVAVGKHAGEP